MATNDPLLETTEYPTPSMIHLAFNFRSLNSPPRNLPQAFGSTTTVNTIDNYPGGQHVDYDDEFDEEKPSLPIKASRAARIHRQGESWNSSELIAFF